jgi:mono/diheme cytochrome c family protein
MMSFTHRRFAAMLALAAVVACSAQTGPVADRAAPDPDAPRRGQYLFDAANCVECHTDTKNGGARLAGGEAIGTPFGNYFSRNITPDPTYGIGQWRDRDFLQALRQGIAPGGGHYFPAFPFRAFTGMTDRDILDIKAYLMTQAPVAQANKPHDVSFPFDVRGIMVLWRLIYFTQGPLESDPAQSVAWNRGAYLANAVSHCGECHTPRNFLGAPDNRRRFAGLRHAGSPARPAPNLTPDPIDGIGTWSLDDIATVLKTGITPKGDFVLAPMSDVVNGTSKLTDDDRHAIAVYLKSLPAQSTTGG